MWVGQPRGDIVTVSDFEDAFLGSMKGHNTNEASKERNRNIAELFEQGASIEALATKFHLREKSIHEILYRIGRERAREIEKVKPTPGSKCLKEISNIGDQHSYKSHNLQSSSLVIAEGQEKLISSTQKKKERNQQIAEAFEQGMMTTNELSEKFQLSKRHINRILKQEYQDMEEEFCNMTGADHINTQGSQSLSLESSNPIKNTTEASQSKVTSVKIVQAKITRKFTKTKKSVRVYNYQLEWLQKTYPSKNFSEALRLVIDQTIIISSQDPSWWMDPHIADTSQTLRQSVLSCEQGEDKVLWRSGEDLPLRTNV